MITPLRPLLLAAGAWLAALPPILAAGPAPTAPRAQRGDIDAGGGLRVTRGLALGFAEGTLLFDADRLRPAALWFGGFVDPVEQPYFGLAWKAAGAAAPAPAIPPPLWLAPGADTPVECASILEGDPGAGSRFDGFHLGADSIRLDYQPAFGSARPRVREQVRVLARGAWRGVERDLRVSGLPAGARVALAFSAAGPGLRHTASGEPATADDAPLASFTLAGQPLVARASGAPGWRWAGAGGGWRLDSAPADAGGEARLRAQVWLAREPRPAGAPTAAELADLARGEAESADRFDGPVAPAAGLPPVAPATANTVPRLAPLKPSENIETFPAVRARAVRMSIAATNSRDGAGIDELEARGPAGTTNLARAATASASSVISGYPIHQIPHLNDGKLGNAHSWVAGAKPSWIRLDWAEPVELDRLVWARDRTGVCKDRLAVDYTVEVSTDGVAWTTVCSSADHGPAAPLGSVRADAAPGYRMESIPPPFPECRPSDLAFDGRGGLWLVEMTRGEIWRTRAPPAGQPTQVGWSRFASGLNHPVGLQLLDGRVFVAQKPEITELIDRDGDGVAEHHRTLASGWGLSHGWHEYTFGLALDDQRHLWFALNTGFFWTNPGYVNPGRLRGSILRVPVDGGALETMATGCRVPNGIARGPAGGIFFTDNQGDWIQSCKLAHVVPGRFYGHPETRADALPADRVPDGASAVWFPYTRSRSSSGPAHDTTGGAFGPFADQLFVGDVGYGGNPGILRVALEQVDGEWQGACFRFLDDQPLGCERMRFGPDGRLYQCSLTTGLTALSFTGETPVAIHSMRIRPRGEGFVLRLTRPLPAEARVEPAAFQVRRYNYVYSGAYGSPETDIQPVPVTAAALSADRGEITLTLPVETHPLGRVYELKATPLIDRAEAWYTVQRIPR